MKKLMIALSAMAMAATVSASTFAWCIEGVPASGTDTSPEGYSVLCFIHSDKSETTTPYALSDALTLLGQTWSAENAATLASKAYYSNGQLDGDGNYTSAFTAANEDWKNKTEVEAYAIVFNDADPTKATQYMIAGENDGDDNIVPYYLKFTNATSNKSLYLENDAWTDLKSDPGPVPPVVPEPTSGLLLLVGVAGLALRRRRA